MFKAIHGKESEQEVGRNCFGFRDLEVTSFGPKTRNSDRELLSQKLCEGISQKLGKQGELLFGAPVRR